MSDLRERLRPADLRDLAVIEKQAALGPTSMAACFPGRQARTNLRLAHRLERAGKITIDRQFRIGLPEQDQ